MTRGDARTRNPEPSAGPRFAAVLMDAADRFTADLSGRLGVEVSVSAGEAARGSAGGLLPRIGEVVVALERTVTGAASAPILGLCSGEDAAWLAALAGGQPDAAADQRAAGFDPDQHRDPAGQVLDGLLQTAVAVLAGEVGVALTDAVGQPKVFSLEKDLNRAVSFLGEGDLRAAQMKVSAGGAGEAGEAVVWVLTRPALAEALDAQPPPERRRPPPQGDLQSLLRLAVPVIVILAEKQMVLRDILKLSIGEVIEFDKPCDEFLELLVNNRCVGRGEAVKVGDKFGLRIVEIGDLRDTIRRLGRSEPVASS
jgi:flagellar motor switch protein FliN